LENIINDAPKAAHYGFKLINDQLAISDDTPVSVFNDQVLALAGPPVLQQVAEDCFNEGLLNNILPNTQIMCVSNSANSCQMRGNVSHGEQNGKYRRALRILRIPHYNDFLSRVNRKIYRFLANILPVT